MKQTRLASLSEAIINVGAGFGINYIGNITILPLLGVHVSHSQAFTVGLIFTVISVIRSYIMRRVFNSGALYRAYKRMKREDTNIT